MNFIAASDLHMADKAPASRIDADFPEELFELLEQLLQAAIAVKAKAIAFPGDLTHVRSRMGWATLTRMIGWCFRCKAAGIDVVAIPGNHDLLLNRYDTLPDTSLGLMFQVGAMINVSARDGGAVRYSDTAGQFNEGDELVEVTGVPFPDAFKIEEWQRVNVFPPAGTRFSRIVLGHCFANTSAGSYFGDPVHSYSDLLHASGADYIILGHDHTDRGVTRYGGMHVIDLGAMSRSVASADDIARDMKFAIIDTTARTVTQYRFNARPASALFDLEARGKVALERQQVEQFVARLQDDLRRQAAGTTVEAKMDGLNLPAQVRERVVAYIEAAEQAQEDALNG
jgi:DNA repair exonuclease SbcCD nuclease subunit